MFFQWTEQVQKIIFEETSLYLSDLPDQCLQTLYDDGLSPGDAALLALADIGLDIGPDGSCHE